MKTKTSEKELVGSYEWFMTLLSKQKRIATFLDTKTIDESKPYIDDWANDLLNISSQLIAWFNDFRPDKKRWISVNDELPDEYKTVKVFCNDTDHSCDYYGWYVLMGDYAEWSINRPLYKNAKVTHWMPIYNPEQKPLTP